MKGGVTFAGSSFTNDTSKRGEYYLRLHTQYWPNHDFRLSIPAQTIEPVKFSRSM